MAKKYLEINVYDACKQRMKQIFDHFPKIYISFSGGKDSTVMLHMAVEEAKSRNRKVGLLFVDLEGQYKLTIQHIIDCIDLYKDYLEIFWISLPLNMRNAVSQFEPQWTCWDPDKKNDWIRQPPDIAITDVNYFPFYNFNMEFEEFVPEFGHWYSKGELTACLVGIRSDESLNRYRTINNKNKSMFMDWTWTTYLGRVLYNAYPIYDWQTRDIWIYHSKFNELHNELYDRMYQAGLSIHEQRICQPYGDDQRKGLWLFHVIEPETWSRIVARVNGANQGSLYARTSGNILGRIKIDKPPGHTWESFSMLLLNSMPKKTSEHYKNKIAVFLNWWACRGYENGIPDMVESHLEANKTTPSWRRVCKCLLRNDYWCKGLSFSQQKSTNYAKYLQLMKRRREQWQII